MEIMIHLAHGQTKRIPMYGRFGDIILARQL